MASQTYSSQTSPHSPKTVSRQNSQALESLDPLSEWTAKYNQLNPAAQEELDQLYGFCCGEEPERFSSEFDIYLFYRGCFQLVRQSLDVLEAWAALPRAPGFSAQIRAFGDGSIDVSASQKIIHLTNTMEVRLRDADKFVDPPALLFGHNFSAHLNCASFQDLTSDITCGHAGGSLPASSNVDAAAQRDILTSQASFQSIGSFKAGMIGGGGLQRSDTIGTIKASDEPGPPSHALGRTSTGEGWGAFLPDDLDTPPWCRRRRSWDQSDNGSQKTLGLSSLGPLTSFERELANFPAGSQGFLDASEVPNTPGLLSIGPDVQTDVARWLVEQELLSGASQSSSVLG